MNTSYDRKNIYKILLIGDSRVGKTSFLSRFSGKEFKEKMISTIGCDYFSKEMVIEKDNPRLIELWDTAGQEKFNALTKNMFKGADGILLFYDITDRKTYVSVTKWINDIKKLAQEEVQLVIVGNKHDLEDQREIKSDQGEKISQAYKTSFIETSCYNNYNINEAVELISRKVFEERANNLHKDLDPNNDSISLSKTKHKKPNKCCKKN